MDERSTTTAGNTSSVVQNLLRSLQGNQPAPSQDPERLFTSLTELLPPSSTIPFLESADEKRVDCLLGFLPPSLLLLAHGESDISNIDNNPEFAEAAFLSLELSQKKDIIRRVLRSPQFTQSLASLTIALRDGGLPSISEALRIPVENAGYVRRGGVPLGGGDAVEAFLEGIRRHVAETYQPSEKDQMETEE